MTSVIVNEIYSNIINTVIGLLVIMFAYGIVDLLFARKIENIRQKRKFRVRSLYIAAFVFIFLIARIWVEGFTHLLAVLGIVSAALVITNKETIMNIVGWLVINWRGLFAEDDLVQIQHYKGYVKSLGVFYFTLLEVSETSNEYITGCVVKVPNGLVTNNGLINFSQTSNLIEKKFMVIITQDSDTKNAITVMGNLVKQVLAEYYKGKKEYSSGYLMKKHKHIFMALNLEPRVSINPKFDRSLAIELTTHYYCFFQDAENIQHQIWLTFLETIEKESSIKLISESN